MSIKNVTFSVDEQLIRKARERAKNENKSLNQVIRVFIAKYAEAEDKSDFRKLMQDLSYASIDHIPSRDEMNER